MNEGRVWWVVTMVVRRRRSRSSTAQIQISHSTYLLVKDEFYCRPLGNVHLKGMARDVTTYEVVAELSSMGQEEAIVAQTEGFNLVLDRSILAPQRAELAREALRNALAALGEETGTANDTASV